MRILLNLDCRFSLICFDIRIPNLSIASAKQGISKSKNSPLSSRFKDLLNNSYLWASYSFSYSNAILMLLIDFLHLTLLSSLINGSSSSSYTFSATMNASFTWFLYSIACITFHSCFFSCAPMATSLYGGSTKLCAPLDSAVPLSKGLPLGTIMEPKPTRTSWQRTLTASTSRL